MYNNYKEAISFDKLAEGIITQEEFEQKKKQLLGIYRYIIEKRFFMGIGHAV